MSKLSENMHVIKEKRNNPKRAQLENGEDNSVVGMNVKIGEED